MFLFSEYKQFKLANLLTCDETWILYFESVRKQSNKIWATRYCKRPINAKRTLGVKKFLYTIFVSIEAIAVQVPVKRGKSITGKLQQRCHGEETEEVVRPFTWFKHLHLLHGNVPAHTSAIVSNFFKQKEFSVLPHPDILQILLPANIFLPTLKKYLTGRKYPSRQALGSAVFQHLSTIPKSAYHDAFRK